MTANTPTFQPVPSDHPSYAGQATYNSSFLRIYDPFVVHFSGRFIYRCPSNRLQRMYDMHAGQRHLDLGPGSGYFLDRCRFGGDRPELTLVDLNPDVLRYAAHRLRRHGPSTLQADVLQPLPLEPGRFDSIAMNYLLHCLPGTIQQKSHIFPGLAALLAPGGVLFGSTAVAGDGSHGWLERLLVPIYNRKGILSNADDSEEELTARLRTAFGSVQIERRGSIVLFVARV
jgi:SAM-dependent methyltransferase